MVPISKCLTHIRDSLILFIHIFILNSEPSLWQIYLFIFAPLPLICPDSPKGWPPRPNRLFFFNIVQTGGGGSNPCSKNFVAVFVYFWALFGAIIRDIIRNINVQKRGGGSKAVWTMLKKTDDLVREGVPYKKEYIWTKEPPIAGIDRSDPETQIDAATEAAGGADTVVHHWYIVFSHLDQCILLHYSDALP